MSLLDGIGKAAAAAATPLTRAATLTRDGTDYDIRAARHRSPKPSRAAQTGAAYDALIRIQGTDLPVDPVQNDTIALSGETWIVWRLRPSPAGGSIMAECMAPADEQVTPLTLQDTDDGGGGKTQQEVAQTAILAKVYGLSTEKVLTAAISESLARLVIRWPYDAGDAEIAAGKRVRVRGMDYTVQSTGVDDENPAWRRAMLARSE